MIIHRYDDGSEGYEYAIGDRVVVERTIHGGWFGIGPTSAERCTVEKIGDGSWRIAIHEIRYSPEWGTASCFRWMFKPHAETTASAIVQMVTPNEKLPGGREAG